jgi:hypothetical protein
MKSLGPKSCTDVMLHSFFTFRCPAQVHIPNQRIGRNLIADMVPSRSQWPFVCCRDYAVDLTPDEVIHECFYSAMSRCLAHSTLTTYKRQLYREDGLHTGRRR